MDDYTKYCFDKLMSKHPEYLKRIDFDTKEKVLLLGNAVDQKTYQGDKLIPCKFCDNTNTIERSQQTRSIDEGETVFIHCKTCDKTYKK